MTMPKHNVETPAGGGGEPAGPRHRYDAALANEIEPRWQDWWAAQATFTQPNPGEPGFDGSKPRFYILDMFPYPSGAGLHVGHPEGYTATDIVSRFKRMSGHNVLHPMGYDAFGLPAEQHAINTGEHPEKTTNAAIENFGRQLRRFGFDYDWSREVRTIDPAYYKWTQWIWLRAYRSWFDPHAENREGTTGAARPISELIDGLERERLMVSPSGEIVRVDKATHDLSGLSGEAAGTRSWGELTGEERRRVIDGQRLAYLDEQVVNWCPKLGTALANEEVIDGRSERGSHPVLRKPLRQWMFRITAYADRLLASLNDLDWPASTRSMQREWIGRSEGAEIDFALDVPDEIVNAVSGDGAPGALRVFTTRPDTVFGATYMVVAPEHALIDALLASPEPETNAATLRAYAEAARNRSELERQESKQKTGVFTGAYCVNPATGEKIPVWCADYVLAGYGTGAIMAVPAHDERDFAFAEAFGLPIRDVVYPRPLAALQYAATHADDSIDQQRWAELSADMVAYVAANNIDPDGFPEAFDRVTTRRRDDRGVGARFADASKAVASEIGEQRGVLRENWADTLTALGFADPGATKRVFEMASVHAASGDAFTGPGFGANSANESVSLDGLAVAEAKARIIDWLEDEGLGTRRVNYKLRDWLFSRQRYWGEPFPVVFDEDGDHFGVSDEALPVELPPLDDYTPVESDDPQPLLGKATDWVETTAGEAGVDENDVRPDAKVRRETNTMPGWAGSCWYYLRYCDPHNADAPVGEGAMDYWLSPTEANPVGGVDLYVGGAEHATLHLLYARFWHKILFDLGHVNTAEPFGRLFHQGLILSHAYQRADKSLVPTDEVEERSEGVFIETATGEPVTQVVAKMSKSLRNVVNPDDIIAEFGTDAFRLYEMYMGPLEQSKPWATKDLVGLYRFLQRAWRLVINEDSGEPTGFFDEADAATASTEKLLHRTIAKVSEDIERLAFNTAIATLIEFVNAANKTGITRSQALRFVKVLCPFAPHIAEEMWSRLGEKPPVSLAQWPAYDEAMLVDDEVEVPIQLMGKVKTRIMVPASADAEALETFALAHPDVQALIEGKTVRKVIAVPGRLVNIVAN